jgi:hypothetical protein
VKWSSVSDGLAAVAVPEDTAEPLVPLVEAPCVSPVDEVHATAERLVALEDEVVVIRHQAIRVERPAELDLHRSQDAQERQIVDLVEEDRLLRVAAGGDVRDHTSTVELDWNLL